MTPTCQANSSRRLFAGSIGVALLAALGGTGCRQSSNSTLSSPWSGYSSSAPTIQQRQLDTMADLWRRQNEQAQTNLAELQRRQMEQLDQLQRQAQEQARLAQEHQLKEIDRHNQFADQQQQDTQQVEELRRRAMQLDTNNRDLHAQLAQSRQKTHLLEDQVKLLQQRLGEAAAQLESSLSQKVASEKRVEALEASTRRRGSATITANNSLARKLTAISIPGVEVRQDGDVVRMELPSDQLFMPQSATLTPAGVELAKQVAESLAQDYPQQIVGIEAHADNVPIGGNAWRSVHQLTAAQAMAIFDQLVQHQGLASQQLFVLGHGPNHPLASNATPAGSARNRRVEIVVYPETVNDR